MSYYLIGGEAEQICTVVRTGQVSDLQSLLDTGVDIDAADHNGETALHTAVYQELDDMVKELLDRGANPDVQNKNGQTPLHLAASNGYDTLVTMLVETGADKSLATQFSEMTALHLASKNGHNGIVQYLLDNGADPNMLDMAKKPPKFYAASQEIVEQLEKHADASEYKTDQYDSESLDDLSSDDDDDNDGASGSRKKRRSHKEDEKAKNSLQDQKMEYSDKFKRRMKLSVFDRLTRSKSKLEKL